MPDINQIINTSGIDGRRALFAYQCVSEVLDHQLPTNLSVDARKKYATLIKKMPAYVKTNGLGQTLAFYFSKSKPEHTRLLTQAGQYFTLQEILAREPDSPQHLLQTVIKMNSFSYRHATLELFRWLDWLRRFADGMIEF